MSKRDRVLVGTHTLESGLYRDVADDDIEYRGTARRVDGQVFERHMGIRMDMKGPVDVPGINERLVDTGTFDGKRAARVRDIQIPVFGRVFKVSAFYDIRTILTMSMRAGK